MAVKLNTHAHLIGEPETCYALPGKDKERKKQTSHVAGIKGFARLKSSELNNPRASTFQRSSTAVDELAIPFECLSGPPERPRCPTLESRVSYAAQIVDSSAAI